MPAPRATSSACSSSGSSISREWKGSLCGMAQGEDVGEMEAAITSRKRGREGFLSVSPPTSPYFFSLPSKAREVGGVWRRAPANERRGKP